MRTIKYKHICPQHGLETCHCVNGITSQKHNGVRFRGIHFCTQQIYELSLKHEPPRFTGERFTKDELYTRLKVVGKNRTAAHVIIAS